MATPTTALSRSSSPPRPPVLPGSAVLRGSSAQVPGPQAVLRAFGELMFLVLSVSCPGCGLPDRALCRTCRDELMVPPRKVGLFPGDLPVWSGPDYADVVARTVVAWKERGRSDVTGPLAEACERLIDPAVRATGARWVVPVPSRAAARRRRGQDLVTCLARRSLRLRRRRGVGPPVGLAAVLRITRPVRDQTGLNTCQRQGNLAGALGPRPGGATLVRSRPCLILDDVLTTGTTVQEAARALQQMGAIAAGIVTFCSTPPGRPLSHSRPLV